MQAAWKAGSGLAQLCAASRHSRGPVHSRAAWVPPRSLWVGAAGQGGPPSKAGVLRPPGLGLRLGQGPHGLVAPRPPCLALGSGTWGSTSAARPHSCCSVVKPAHQPLPPSRKLLHLENETFKPFYSLFWVLKCGILGELLLVSGKEQKAEGSLVCLTCWKGVPASWGRDGGVQGGTGGSAGLPSSGHSGA